MPWNAQITDALRNGTLSGLLVNLDSGDDIHAWQAAKEVRVSPRLWLGHVYLLVMNKTRWKSLSEEDKAAIRRAAVRTEKTLGVTLDTSLKQMTQNMSHQGAHVRTLTPQELNTWQHASRYQAVQADWVAQQEAKGVQNADATLKAVSALLKQVQ